MTSHFAIKRNAIALLLAYLTQSVIFADTVRLKDGRIITNVKSKIEGKQILLESPDGTTRSFPMDMLKTIMDRCEFTQLPLAGFQVIRDRQCFGHAAGIANSAKCARGDPPNQERKRQLFSRRKKKGLQALAHSPLT